MQRLSFDFIDGNAVKFTYNAELKIGFLSILQSVNGNILTNQISENAWNDRCKQALRRQ